MCIAVRYAEMEAPLQLIFKSRNGTAILDWSEYALLRDNVQHYLESSPGDARYDALHAVERAVDGEPSQVNALGLRRELQRAWPALAGLTLSQSAVSLRTLAFLTGCDRAPPVTGTAVAKLTGWPLPVVADEPQPLQARLATFVESLLTITARARPTDHVYIARSDAGEQPTLVRALKAGSAQFD
jgi:hypothetical protein